ncbi:MAG: hypothetical protein IMY88_02920, partial [Chloroflexi bacterium]|nr:hypothetical protein [Chloroflexota bacterium]
SDTLKKAQQAGTLNPLYKIVLTKGESSYSYEEDRILPSEHDEEMYSHRAKVVLSNRDKEFNDKDLKGYDAVISYGFGKEYSPTSPLAVIDQQFSSTPDELTCTLELEGMPNLMAEDEASEVYQPDDTDTKPVKTLVNAIVGATLAPFTHCHAFEVVWNTGYDPLANTYKPKDSFRVYSGGSRLAALRRVLDYTANVPRFEADGKVHILKPVTTGTDFDSEYSLERGSHHFFRKAYRDTLVFPNRVVVKSRSGDDPQYQGEAQVDGYDSLPAKVKKTRYVQVRLESNNQGNSIAEALIAKAEMGAARGQAEIRINIGAEVSDYVKVTDQRQGDTRTGNLGYIHRRFGKDKWMMTFGFGTWLAVLRYQSILKELETYTDAGQYFPRLNVGDLYVENLLAENMGFVWIDPDNTIDLSKIGDTFDNLPEGEYYYRARKMSLNGETGLTLWEGMKYYIRFSPDSDEAGIRRQDTAPSGVGTGEYWIDTSGVEPIIKRWTGSAWFTIEQAEIDALNKGLLTTHAKLASLSPEGLVLMDEVQVGDEYGKVKLVALTTEGLIFLDQIEDTGMYRKVSIDAVTIDGYIDLSQSGVINKSASYIAETSILKWAGEHGADITGGHTSYDTNRVGGTSDTTIKDGVNRARDGLDSDGFVTKIVPGQYIVLDGNVICTENFIVQGAVGVGKTLYVQGAISAGGGDVLLDTNGIRLIGEHLRFYYSSLLNERGYIYGGSTA